MNINELENKRIRQSKYSMKLRLVKCLSALAAGLPFAIVWFAYYTNHIPGRLATTEAAVMILFMALYSFLGKAYDAFLISYARITDIFTNQVLSILFSDTFMFIVLWLLSRGFPNIIPALLTLLVQVILVGLWCVGAHKWYFKTFPPKRSIVIYDTREGMEQLISQYELNKKFQVEKTLHVSEALADLSVLDNMETVFFSGIHSHDRNIILKHCVDHAITALIIPRLGDVIMSGARRMHLLHLPVMRVDRYAPGMFFLCVKRIFDMLISAAALILLSPLFLVLSLAIRKDGGPAFYKQVRLTRDGRQFKILKFRSMRVDAEKDGMARLSSGENDDRITKVGRFIRACRFDELPQLINILLGDMSIVGPRPERPEIAEQYESVFPEFKLRLQAKAGLTGYAQVYGKYNTTPYDKLNMDLMYIARSSLLEDCRIIFATVAILLRKDSTEGIDPGQTTAKM